MTSKMYTTVGPSLWGKNRFNENEKLIIEFLSFKFTNIFINKFTFYHYFSIGFFALPRFPIFNYWWVIDQKYPKISKRKLKKLFIKFIKNCASVLKNIDNLNEKIRFVQLSFIEANIEKKYNMMNNMFNK